MPAMVRPSHRQWRLVWPDSHNAPPTQRQFSVTVTMACVETPWSTILIYRFCRGTESGIGDLASNRFNALTVIRRLHDRNFLYMSPIRTVSIPVHPLNGKKMTTICCPHHAVGWTSNTSRLATNTLSMTWSIMRKGFE